MNKILLENNHTHLFPNCQHFSFSKAEEVMRLQQRPHSPQSLKYYLDFHRKIFAKLWSREILSQYQWVVVDRK